MRDSHQVPSSTTRKSPELPRPGTGRAGQREVFDSRLTLLTADLRRRLRRVCQHWDDAEFDALVQKIARTKMRWGDPDRAD